MINWFEIPVANMQRAKTFYEIVFDLKITVHKMGDLEMGWFPNKSASGMATGTLIHAGDHYKPSKDGVLIYFSCENVANEIGRVAEAGGQVIAEKKQISESNGYMAYFVDSEGNRIALHSMQ